MSEASVREFVLTATATEITNRIEQQAKELVEAQARVALLSEAIESLSDAFPEYSATYEQARKALAYTDTAAQTLRPKYIEPTSCGRCEYEEADGSLIEQCPKCKAIDAAKEKHEHED